MKQLYYFSAPWCAPCKLLTPVVESMNEFFESNEVDFKKVNIDEDSALVKQYRVRSVPALYYVVNGKVQDSLIGFSSSSDTQHQLRKFINGN